VLARQLANCARVGSKVGVARGKIRQQSSAFLKWGRCDQHEPVRLPCAFIEKFLIGGDKTGQRRGPVDGLGPTKLEHDDGRSRSLQVRLQRRKTHVTRLRKNRVPFPAEVAEAHVETAKLRREQRLQIARVLCRRHISAA